MSHNDSHENDTVLAQFTMSDTKLRVLTLNCWGLKYVSKNRVERMAGIAKALAASDYDIVALQEVWVSADYALIRSSVAGRLPYAKYFYSGALGAGLAIFSRFPIIGTTIHPYSLNGSPIDVVAGDWFVGKAAASILIAHPLLGQLQVYNTHLFAKGGESGPEINQAHRLINAWELAKLARQSAELGRYVIACGDFNTIPTSLPMTVISEHAGLMDSWRATHPQSHLAPNSAPISPVDAIRMHGVSADSPLNSYSGGKSLEAHARRFAGKRLDYVWFREPVSSGKDKPALLCTDTKVVFTDEVPGKTFSFSDHFGVESTFEIRVPPSSSTQTDFQNEVGLVRSAIPDRAPAAGSSTSTESVEPTPTSLSPTSLNNILTTLTAAYRTSVQRARYHLTIFILCLFLVIVLVVLFPFLPSAFPSPLTSGWKWTYRALSWIYGVVIVALSWLATTMLYVGFVYGRWEVNALTNVIEEMEILRSLKGSRYESRSSEDGAE
ncbi:DNase I-like protein [Gloeophyllum trabeum ATCC 11539]|uniref:DNase I-like protein n=1 Tax=Gloeophyllum trabeum (strain ATCC 11539 / FP-39264 / Madison 617) TaxID=670483 RepID=S7RZ28_GLOTA|nr:DNase I-like protein [Gloeophyllum trabeum ATCC 11539]EPQ60245.1 DNase I-like protein [Gloeophyllum trabeum ATCC 11539]